MKCLDDLDLEETNVAHADGCAYCLRRWRYQGDPWEWFAKIPGGRDRARFVWGEEVATAAARFLRVYVHPVSAEGEFLWAMRRVGGNRVYLAFPYCIEEALRHCKYEQEALGRLFRKMNEQAFRSAAGAAFRLGGSFALRDYLRGAGAL